jgi:hypothetical protein
MIPTSLIQSPLLYSNAFSAALYQCPQSTSASQALVNFGTDSLSPPTLTAVALVHHSAGVFELIPKIREVIGDETRVRSVGGLWQEVWPADAEKGATQARAVLDCLVGYGAAPVMTAKEHRMK